MRHDYADRVPRLVLIVFTFLLCVDGASAQPRGRRSVKQAAPDALFVLVVPPSWQALHSRLSGRGTESQEQLERRLAVAREEIGCYHLYDFVVINGELEVACGALRDIIVAGRQGLEAQRPFLEDLLRQADDSQSS